MPIQPSAAYTVTDAEEPAALLPNIRVTVTLPNNTRTTVPLGIRPLLLGTSPDCDVVLTDSKVSRRHCDLRLTARGIIIRDLGSKNGTVIGDAQIIEAILPIGAIVSLGNSRLVATLEGMPAALPLSTFPAFGEVVGKSVAMRALFATLEAAAAATESVLLVGEPGTAKTELARAFHAASSRRAGPFIVLDGSAVVPNLIEVQLFGHPRGAAPPGAEGPGLLEQAHNGTLFIDEVGELPPEVQPKLAKALDARQARHSGTGEWCAVDVRVVAATHRSLRNRVAEGWFHADLYARLSTVEVVLPPLRERKEDIPLLVERILATYNPPRTIADLPPNAMDLLIAHDWPGNLRELRAVVSRLIMVPDLPAAALVSADARVPPIVPLPPPPKPAAVTKGAPLRAGPLRAGPPRPAPRRGLDAASRDAAMTALLQLPLREARELVLERFERSYLTAKLKEHGGDIASAAAASGASQDHIEGLMHRYGLRAG